MNPEIEKRIKSFNNDKAVKALFYYTKSLIEALQLSVENEKLALNIRNDYRKRISVNLNSRLVLSLHESEQGLVFQFMVNNEDLSAITAIDGLNLNVLQKETFDSSFTDATLISISVNEVLSAGSMSELEYKWLKACKEYEPAQEKSQFRKHHIPELFEMATDETILNKYLITNNLIQTLFTRLANIRQYNQQNKIVVWEDITATRWNNMYSKLNINDQAIFLLKGKVLLGTIESISMNTSIKVKDIVEYTISNDDFLRLNEVNPENISTIKANFHPFISPIPIDFTILKKEIVGKIFVSFYIINKDVDTNNFNQNDRIVIIDDDGIINWLNQIENNQIVNFKNFRMDLFGARKKTFNQIAQLHATSTKSNNIAAVQRMINGVNKDGIYKFNSFSEYYNIIHNKSLYRGIKDEDEIEVEMEVDYTNNSNLNQILYGPPGTGKTYHSINKALEIIGYDFEGKTREMIKKDFDYNAENGQIIFSTFHQNMSYEDFIEGIKPIEPKTENSPINYKIVDGIFKKACAIAAYNCYDLFGKSKLQPEKYSFDDLYYSFIESIQNQIDNHISPVYKTLLGREVEVKEINSNNSIIARAKNSIAKKSAPLTKENLQKLYDRFKNIEEITNLKQVQETVQITPRITEFYAVFTGLKTFEKSFKPDEQLLHENYEVEGLDLEEIQKNFNAGVYKEAIIKFGKQSKAVVLIIDEINRGNVSQIFGELITLIEENKRLGKDEMLEVVLPYSKERFGVPPNLYIIGTMNTADRSVEALDTALRRRFCFEEMMPQPNLIAQEGALNSAKGLLGDISLVEVLKTINQRIEVLLNRDHLIGHSYFLTVANEENLQETFYKNIIPLLQEYFYGDYGKIGLVLGSGFIREKFNDNKMKVGFAKFKYEDLETLQKTVYEIVPASEVNIIEAMHLLLNNKG